MTRQKNARGTFSVVATPIGNLEDITARALRALTEADLVLCEDTRVTRKLLARYDIKTPTESYHTHSRFRKTEKILAMLRDGKKLALVSDAGTPTISDPGSHLVFLIRNELGDAVKIESIPGPSAVIAALAISGFSASEFLFLGFLPHKKRRKTLFREIAASKRTVALYESPHRLLKTLKALQENLPFPRKVAVVRELTKIYEEAVVGTAAEVLAHFENNPDTVKGECVILVEGK